MDRLDVAKELEKKFSLLNQFMTVYVVRDDKSFRGAYCDFVAWLRRESGVSVQLFIFRPGKDEVYFYGDFFYAAELSKMFGGRFQQDWRDIYCWWLHDKNLDYIDIEKAVLFTKKEG